MVYKHENHGKNVAELLYTTTLKMYQQMRSKINSKPHARELLRLIGSVPVYIFTLNLYWLQIRINT